jgi:hypothetical protein
MREAVHLRTVDCDIEQAALIARSTNALETDEQHRFAA